MSAEVQGFSLHAGVRMAASDSEGRERLFRYCARPSRSVERFSMLPDGRVAYALKKPGRRGSTHRRMEPQERMARLAALVPPPWHPLIRFHGVRAPHHAWRSSGQVPLDLEPSPDSPDPQPTPAPTAKETSRIDGARFGPGRSTSTCCVARLRRPPRGDRGRERRREGTRVACKAKVVRRAATATTTDGSVRTTAASLRSYASPSRTTANLIRGEHKTTVKSAHADSMPRRPPLDRVGAVRLLARTQGGARALRAPRPSHDAPSRSQKMRYVQLPRVVPGSYPRLPALDFLALAPVSHSHLHSVRRSDALGR